MSLEDHMVNDEYEKRIAELEQKVKELEKLNEWHKKDVHDAMEWKRDLEAKLKEAEHKIHILERDLESR